ncbi:MAG TPA: ABC transporter substrate-binding protein [Gemmatimonadaceae bacterium]|nr:ABC transporter substrate-binding protein [Gemmatimonadaceae bacterium]
MRVISLLPGVTDTIVALGGSPLLVGVSHSCDHAAVARVPRVTAAAIDPAAPPGEIDAAVREMTAAGRPLHALNESAIDRLQPDLIFTQALCDVCAVSEAEVARVASGLRSHPRVVSLSGGTIDGLLDDVMTVGRATGLADEAEELVLGLRRRMRRVHDALKAARAPRPRVALLEWTDPLFASGHWVPEQVRRAGGTDVLAEPGAHSRAIPVRVLLEANPAVVLVAPCGFGVRRAAEDARRLLSAYPALERAQVWALDANVLTSRPGPRVVDGIEIMAQILAPALFSPVPEALARRIA